MSISMSTCLDLACKRLIKNSSKKYQVKGEIAYLDAMFELVPRMNSVIELLIDNIPEDKLGDIYDEIEALNFSPARFSECTEEDIWGRKNDWIDILEELEKEGEDNG